MNTAFVLSGNCAYWFQAVFKAESALKGYKPNLASQDLGVRFSLV